MLEPFQLPSMQRAAIEIALLAPLAGLLGAQIVLRRLAFYGHSVGAAAFPGVVVAGPAGIPVWLGALAAAGGFAAMLERLRRPPGAVATDAATALLLVAALAVGVLLASDVFHTDAEAERALFGSLLAIGPEQLRFSTVALALTLLAALRFRPAWLAGGFDPASSRSLGLPAGADLALVVVIAVAAVASIDAAGSLLVAAILVVPAATVRPFAHSVATLELSAGALALLEGIGGLLIAFHLDVPPGAAIAVLGGVAFTLALVLRALGASRAAGLGGTAA